MKRRTLLTNALLGAPAVQTALLTSAARAAQTAPAEELSADVLVLGAGFAGLASAIAAARAGARVAVLEKRGYAGGDGILSAGILAAAGTPLHEAQGIPGDWSVEAYWQRILDGKEDEPLSKVRDNMPLSPIYSGVAKHNPEVLRRSAFRSPDVAAFVQSFGIEFLPINPHQPFLLPSKPGSMPRLAKAMLGELERLGAAVLLNVQAESLQLENGRMAGALARRLAGPYKGGALRIEAPAVIAATGGFSDNEALMKRYKRVWADIPIGFTAVGEGVPPGHDGDGIQMGRRIGAGVEDMESMPKLYAAPRKGMRSPSWILFDTDSAYLVDRGGKRFVNEHEARYAGCAVEAFRRHIDGAYMVFDEETFRGPNSERWQLAKIFAAGGLFKGWTPEEAAAAAGVDPQGLRETVERINADAARGADSEYGRRDRLFRALSGPFYVSAPSWPVRFKTEGGLEVNPDFVVIRASDESPIEGFYAAGATCGSISSRLCDVLASALIAGENAAKSAKAQRTLS